MPRAAARYSVTPRSLRRVAPTSSALIRALESGLQDAGDPDRHGLGVPGIALRTVGRNGDAAVPILPGTGRVFVYADSPTGRLWRRYFPESPGLGRGLVAQTVQGLLRRSRSSVRDAAREVALGAST